MQQGAKGTHTSLDEFKHGFPTNGLAVVSYKWWGSSSSDSNEDLSRRKEGTDFQEDTKKTEELVDDGEKPASGKDESNNIPLGTGFLSQLRKSAAEDGRKSLRLGVYRGYGVRIPGRRERNLVLRMFNSSLPTHWRYGSS